MQEPSQSEPDTKLQDTIWLIIMSIFELLMVLMYALFFDLNDLINPKYSETHFSLTKDQHQTFYPLFMHSNVIVWAAFPLFYTYFHYHKLSNAVLTFFNGLFSYQFYLLCLGFFRNCFSGKWEKIKLDVISLIEGNFGAAATMVSMGGVLGKFNMNQYFFISIIEPIFCSLNYVLGDKKLHAVDVGGAMFTHSFGAFFGIGLSISAFYGNDKVKKIEKFEKRNSSTKNSETLAFLGSTIIMLYWPSFNTCLIENELSRYRGALNSWFAMFGSGISSVITSCIYNKGKLNANDILNSILAGGLVIGGGCNLIYYPYVSLIVGICGGIICTVGFESLSPVFLKLRIYDTAGIFNLYGITGLLGAILTAILIATLDVQKYDNVYIDVSELVNRSKSKQAGYQILVEVITVGISLISGFLTGLVVRQDRLFGELHHYNTDEEFFIDENLESNLNDANYDSNKNYDELLRRESSKYSRRGSRFNSRRSNRESNVRIFNEIKATVSVENTDQRLQ